MNRRFLILESIEVIAKRFNAEAKTIQLGKNYNLSPGQEAPVITCEEPNKVQLFKFGMTPAGAKKQMDLINARAEGDHK